VAHLGTRLRCTTDLGFSLGDRLGFPGFGENADTCIVDQIVAPLAAPGGGQCLFQLDDKGAKLSKFAKNGWNRFHAGFRPDCRAANFSLAAQDWVCRMQSV
jgi:hypothetical protein